MKGLIFNVQRFSTKDGPGIRTTVFFKGCNVNCAWCHNPESIDFDPVLRFDSRRCVDCLACAGACKFGAVAGKNGRRSYDPGKCKLCGACVGACSAGALEIIGKEYKDEDLYNILIKDEDYYRESGGGITFSGGEPLLQVDFLTTVLKKLKAKGLHTAVDSALYVDWERVERILPYTDLILLDIKGMDKLRHKDNTDVGTDLIHSNAVKLSKTDTEIIVRMPLVQGLNDTVEDISAAADFIRGWGNLLGVELLPYHSLGFDKAGEYHALEPRKKFDPPSPDLLNTAAEIFKSAGIKIMG